MMITSASFIFLLLMYNSFIITNKDSHYLIVSEYTKSIKSGESGFIIKNPFAKYYEWEKIERSENNNFNITFNDGVEIESCFNYKYELDDTSRNINIRYYKDPKKLKSLIDTIITSEIINYYSKLPYESINDNHQQLYEVINNEILLNNINLDIKLFIVL